MIHKAICTTIFRPSRKTMYRGRERVEEHGLIVAAAYNLMRISRLATAPG